MSWQKKFDGIFLKGKKLPKVIIEGWIWAPTTGYDLDNENSLSYWCKWENNITFLWACVLGGIFSFSNFLANFFSTHALSAWISSGTRFTTFFVISDFFLDSSSFLALCSSCFLRRSAFNSAFDFECWEILSFPSSILVWVVFIS